MRCDSDQCQVCDENYPISLQVKIWEGSHFAHGLFVILFTADGSGEKADMP